MRVNTSAIANFVAESGKHAVLVVDEYQYNSLMEALKDEGVLEGVGPVYGVMATNRDIVRNGGKIAVSFNEECGRPIWAGFCWPDYFRGRDHYYAFMNPDDVFIEEESDDFEFDQSMALTYLFGLGGA